jgi:hypothetical protein
MRTRVTIQACFLVALCLAQFVKAARQEAQSNGYGPAVTSFLQLMRHEEGELEFQIRNNEITRKDYIRSKNRIAIHRLTVIKFVNESGKDHVPELHIVAAPEVDQLIEDGTKALKRIKRGEIIAEKWLYHGSVTRGEIFYIFERLSKH